MIAVSIMIFLFLDCRQQGHHVKIASCPGVVSEVVRNTHISNFHITKELQV